MGNSDLDDVGNRIEADYLAIRREIRHGSERIRKVIVIWTIASVLLEAVGFGTCFVLIATRL